MKVVIFLALVGVGSAINLIGRTQSAAVSGKLTCEGKPLSGVEIKLMESDNSIGPSVFVSFRREKMKKKEIRTLMT